MQAIIQFPTDTKGFLTFKKDLNFYCIWIKNFIPYAKSAREMMQHIVYFF